MHKRKQPKRLTVDKETLRRLADGARPRPAAPDLSRDCPSATHC
jgi:hypothetical protein